MKMFFIISTLMIAPFFAAAQNVGIGITNPAEKLDVNGNINLTGTVKVNGTDGHAGQALMKNNAGVFSWGNINHYNNVVGFRAGSATTSNTIYSWNVPSGVTDIFVEAWGGGGGGASGGGGGGGGYAATQFTVIPGTGISITVGAGGTGAASNGVDAIDGSSSIVQINTLQLLAYGGEGGHATLGGFAGRFSSNTSGMFLYGQSGEPGDVNTETYGPYSSTIYYTAVYFGSGGAGGNTGVKQKNGGFRSFNSTTAATIKNGYSQAGVEPGGGGGGDYYGGKNGAPGLVIIHY